MTLLVTCLNRSYESESCWSNLSFRSCLGSYCSISKKIAKSIYKVSDSLIYGLWTLRIFLFSQRNDFWKYLDTRLPQLDHTAEFELIRFTSLYVSYNTCCIKWLCFHLVRRILDTDVLYILVSRRFPERQVILIVMFPFHCPCQFLVVCLVVRLDFRLQFQNDLRIMFFT